MRVNQSGNNSVQGADVAGARQTGKAAAAQDSKKSGKSGESAPNDSVKADLSAKGKEFAKAKSVAADTSDVREDKIAELKRRIAAGKYEVNADAIADKMVDDHLKTVDIG